MCPFPACAPPLIAEQPIIRLPNSCMEMLNYSPGSKIQLEALTLLNRTLPSRNLLYRKELNRTQPNKETDKTESGKPHSAQPESAKPNSGMW